MIRKLIPLALLPAILALTSCEKLGLGGGGGGTENSGNQSVQVIGGFAIIDLDEVARRTKNDVRLQNALKARENVINQELGNMRSQFQRQVQIKQQEIGTEPTEEQQVQLAQMVNALNVQLNRAQGTAQQTLSNDQVSLIQNFRNQIRPIAVKVALERNFKIVLTRNEAILFAYDESYDITEDVIRQIATPMVP